MEVKLTAIQTKYQTAHSLLEFWVASAAAVPSAVREADDKTGLESKMARRMWSYLSPSNYSTPGNVCGTAA
jgi:hypothetical protein